MKTNLHARKVLRLRRSAILFIFLLLVPATFWMACRIGQDCARGGALAGVPAPVIGHWFVSR